MERAGIVKATTKEDEKHRYVRTSYVPNRKPHCAGAFSSK